MKRRVRRSAVGGVFAMRSARVWFASSRRQASSALRIAIEMPQGWANSAGAPVWPAPRWRISVHWNGWVPPV